MQGLFSIYWPHEEGDGLEAFTVRDGIKPITAFLNLTVIATQLTNLNIFDPIHLYLPFSCGRKRALENFELSTNAQVKQLAKTKLYADFPN